MLSQDTLNNELFELELSLEPVPEDIAVVTFPYGREAYEGKRDVWGIAFGTTTEPVL